MEFVALAQKEREDREFHVRALKRVLINVMGLDLKAKLDDSGHSDINDFVPMALVCGNHHLLQRLVGKAEDTEYGPSTGAVSDEDYEKMSQRVMAGMDPLADDFLSGQDLHKILLEEDTRNAGVKIIEDEPITPSHTVTVTED